MVSRFQWSAVNQIALVGICLVFLATSFPAIADRFEPDNTPATARVAVVNDPAEPHTFETLGDEDWFLFYALPDVPYSIQATSVSARCDVHLTMFQDDGVTTLPGGVKDVNGPGLGETLTTLSLPTGFYHLRLRNFDPQVFGVDVSYALRIDKTVGTTGSARAIDANTVRVEWVSLPPFDFVGWHVFRSTSNSPRNLVRINPVVIPPDQNQYDDTTIVGGLTYYYVVKKEVTPGLVEASAGMFAGIPVETVDERTIGLQHTPGIARQQAAVLKPGPRGYYPDHQIVFHDYVEVATGTAIDVTIRPDRKDHSERMGAGQAFPSRSDALFVVETVDWSGGTATPFRFTDPVDIIVAFDPINGPIRAGWNDRVTFDDEVNTSGQMRIVRDMIDGPGVDFQFIQTGEAPVLGQRTITLPNYVGLTGDSGQAAYGAVVEDAAGLRRWYLYR